MVFLEPAVTEWSGSVLKYNTGVLFSALYTDFLSDIYVPVWIVPSAFSAHTAAVTVALFTPDNKRPMRWSVEYV
jgi:hypothetical protein